MALSSDTEIEQIAVRVARRYETERGATVRSVENDSVGFDLLSTRGLERRCIEVKGRAGVGARRTDVERVRQEPGTRRRLLALRRPRLRAAEPAALPSAEPGEGSGRRMGAVARRALPGRS